MATPYDAPYKVAQRKSKKRINTVNVLWTSCYIEVVEPGKYIKHTEQGTYVKDVHGPIGTESENKRRK